MEARQRTVFQNPVAAFAPSVALTLKPKTRDSESGIHARAKYGDAGDISSAWRCTGEEFVSTIALS